MIVPIVVIKGFKIMTALTFFITMTTDTVSF